MSNQRLRHCNEHKGDGAQDHRARTLFAMVVWVSLTTIACGDSGEVSTGPAELIQGIRGADAVVYKAGVVDFSYNPSPFLPYVRSCTGSMIAPKVLLTAGRCFTALVQAGIREGSSNFNVQYYDPVDGRRLVHSTTGSWRVHPAFTLGRGPGSANSDIAVIKVSEGFGSHDSGGTDYHDYLRIYSDSYAGLHNTHPGAYGAGLYDFSASASDDQLRTYNFWVENATEEHLLLDGNNTSGMCWGDTGGPIVAYVTVGGQSVSTVAGVWSQYDLNGSWIGTEDVWCQGGNEPRDDSVACRMRTSVTDWIEGATGISCAPQSGGSKGYRRCFDLPFIEDVPGEGLDAGLATSIVMAAIW